MKDIIYCKVEHGNEILLEKPWKQGEPVEFMYMPAGRHEITAGFRGKAISMVVSIDPVSTTKTLSDCFETLTSEAPKQKPFGCIEHKEEDASVWAKGFVAKEDGVYLIAEPSALGEHNVNGRIHRSWSPSFTTDADYAKAKEREGVFYFPDGVRGSAKNPAEITGVAFCVGTLTNKPAFRNINPVMAKMEHEANSAGLAVGPILALLGKVRVAHWNASTVLNDHTALGGLYESLDESLDHFVELYMGKRKVAALGAEPPSCCLKCLRKGAGRSRCCGKDLFKERMTTC